MENAKIGNWERVDKRLNMRLKARMIRLLLGTSLAGAVHLSAANLPGELRQMRDYFNNPPALTNITYVVTNYITPEIFTSIADMQRAMRSAEFNFGQQTVDYYGYSYDPELPGSILRSLPGDLFQNHILHDRSILTNDAKLLTEYQRLPFFMGRSNHVWWNAVHTPITGLSFDVLTNSTDGLWRMDPEKEPSPFFRDSLLGVGTTFSHFGFGLFEPGTWRIQKKDEDLFEWSGKTARSGEIGGMIWSTNNQWVMHSNPPWEITRRIEWDSQSRLPRTISVIHNDNHAQLYRTLTRVDTPMVWWELYPEAFHYNYHTNAGIRKPNEIEFFLIDGSRISNYSKRHYDSLQESKAMSRRVQFYRFLLFMAIVGGTGFFLWRRAYPQKQKNQSPN